MPRREGVEPELQVELAMLNCPEIVHPQTLRHGNRSHILFVDEADEAGWAQVLQRRGNCGLGSLGRYSPTPEGTSKRPPHLDLVGELRHVIGMRAANQARGVPGGAVIDQPKTEAVPLPVLDMVAEAPPSMLGVERRAGAKRVPDIGIGPDGKESILVVRTNTSQREPGGFDGLRIGHSGFRARPRRLVITARYIASE
jgi:prepilin-type processing-associated H-X9-DG protein